MSDKMDLNVTVSVLGADSESVAVTGLARNALI